jgi:hypothetical protein
MAGVIQTQSGGGGFLGKLLGVGATLASGGLLGPAAAAAAPWLGAGSALLNGDAAGALGQAAGAIKPNTSGVPNPELFNPSFSDVWINSATPSNWRQRQWQG